MMRQSRRISNSKFQISNCRDAPSASLLIYKLMDLQIDIFIRFNDSTIQRFNKSTNNQICKSTKRT